MKFGRLYTMTVQKDDNTDLIIESPLTVEFDISRSTLRSANTGSFRIYNLSRDNRQTLKKDRWDTLNYKSIRFEAGYQGEPRLPVIFQGNIQEASSRRVGPNWITEIEAFDGLHGIQNGNIATTFPAGFDITQVIKTLISTMPNIAAGTISSFENNNSRGITLAGNSWDILNNLVGDNGLAFIDQEKAHVLNINDFLTVPGAIPLISSDTGLLDAPRRYDATLQTRLIFEPRLVIGQLVNLLSIEAYNNGLYQVIGVSHRGTIGEGTGGEAVTTLDLWLGTEQLKAA